MMLVLLSGLFIKGLSIAKSYALYYDELILKENANRFSVRSMATLELPQSSKSTIALAGGAFIIALWCTISMENASVWLFVLALAISGFVGDLFTGLAHFGFDYVFPEKMPILGPIAKEFREHHDSPTLDPSDYVVNLTKGAYASLPLSIVTVVLIATSSGSWLSFLCTATFLGMSFWAFFFHQIHSYAHMGACVSPDDFKASVQRISRLPTLEEKRREFEKLFDAAPIPPVIRLLQKSRIILNPEMHNLHHISFESDFSSVNGWSDPLINWILGPLARRLKARSEAADA